jgi:photosystem II stability/assembly factor-like uncharacterized protein
VQLHVATRKGLFTFDADGEGHELAFKAIPVTALARSDRGLVVAVRHGHYGPKLHRRGPDGFAEIGAPAFPRTDDADAPSVDQVWVLERGPDGRLWAGTLPAGLFVSSDDGDSWTPIAALTDRPEAAQWVGGGFDMPGVHSIVVHPTDADQITVAISCGGVWTTGDGGDTWTLVGEGQVATFMPPARQRDLNIQDPHRIAACRAHPDRVWMQHHCGVFRSDDAGVTWTQLEVPPTGFGFAVAAHPTDPDSAWLVPAESDQFRVPVDGQVVVARTRDGGTSWELLRAGLPQESAYDLVFRHALDIDDAGRRLAFGSTTGNLWASSDAGDSWRTLSRHLPPIYAVRWI